MQNPSPALWLLAALALLLFAGLSFGRSSAPSGRMDTTTSRPRLTASARAARRAAQARRRRAEDKADAERAAARIADIEAGRSRVYSREEAWRVLGLQT